MIRINSKRAQEEIVGFAIIVIIVSIILVFFLIFSLSDKPETASYEAESFLQSALYYTSSCAINDKFLPVQDLVVSCYNKQKCDNEQDACTILNETLKSVLEESWPVGPDFPVKGYKMEIFTQEEEIIPSIEKGNITGVYKGAQQILPYAGAQISVLFNVYS